MREVDQTARLHEIQCPMLCVVPDEDPHISLEQYEVIRDNVPGCRFVVYHGYQHNITDAVPDRCAEELKRFLLEHGG
jgi:pimeloyl-ACP methyl ester carboxylesterase